MRIFSRNVMGWQSLEKNNPKVNIKYLKLVSQTWDKPWIDKLDSTHFILWFCMCYCILLIVLGLTIVK